MSIKWFLWKSRFLCFHWGTKSVMHKHSIYDMTFREECWRSDGGDPFLRHHVKITFPWCVGQDAHRAGHAFLEWIPGTYIYHISSLKGHYDQRNYDIPLVASRSFFTIVICPFKPMRLINTNLPTAVVNCRDKLEIHYFRRRKVR